MMKYLFTLLVILFSVVYFNATAFAAPTDVSFEWELYTITEPQADATWTMKLYQNGTVMQELPATVNTATVPYLDNNQTNSYWLTASTPDEIESGPSTVVDVSAIPPTPAGMIYRILFNGEDTGMTAVPKTQ